MDLLVYFITSFLCVLLAMRLGRPRDRPAGSTRARTRSLAGTQRGPHWIDVNRIRALAAGAFPLCAGGAINLLTSDHSHHVLSYVAWFGAALLALLVGAGTTLMIERSRPAALDTPREPRAEPHLRLVPERPSVGSIHARLLSECLADLVEHVSQDRSCGYLGYRERASYSQQALVAHFPDLLPRLIEWDEAVERVEEAPRDGREFIENEVMNPDLRIPLGYDGMALARLVAGTVVRGVRPTLALEAVPDHYSDGERFWTVHAGSRTNPEIGELRDIPDELIKDRLTEHEDRLQEIVDHVMERNDQRIAEVYPSREALADLKQPLLELLAVKQTVSPVLFSFACSYCQAQLQLPIAA